MRRMKWSAGLVASVAAGAVALAAGCSNSMGPSSRHAVSLSVALAGGGPAASGAVSPAFDITQGSGSDTLVLQDVSLVMDRVELRSMSDSCAAAEDSAEAESDSAAESDSTAQSDSTAGSMQGSANEGSWGEREHEDGCGVVSAGPVLVDLPLDSAVTHVAQVELPAGTYDKLEFRIHPPMPQDSADSAFLADHPGLEGVSIRVTGTWNGQDFTFERGIEAGQEVHLNPPLEVSDTTTAANVTLSFDVRSWFRREDGSLIDPSTAGEGGAAADIVAENIRRSMASSHCFEDRDRDGHEDHESGMEHMGG